MGKIAIEGIRLYSYHGCMDEEGVVGGNYMVDVYIETDFANAVKSDSLQDTVDYVAVHNIVRDEMEIRSKLIEQVGQRIIDSLKKELKGIDRVEVKVTKLNPPIKGNVERVSVTVYG